MGPSAMIANITRLTSAIIDKSLDRWTTTSVDVGAVRLLPAIAPTELNFMTELLCFGHPEGGSIIGSSRECDDVLVSSVCRCAEGLLSAGRGQCTALQRFSKRGNAATGLHQA
jgi:hypothetical protein